MPYSVDTFSGTRTFLVEDGTINTSLDIRLIGKNYAGYGEVQNENFVHLLENFAGDNPPPRPTNGQIWYDSGTKRIRFWDSSTTSWKSTGSVAVSATNPQGLVEGDLWWNTQTEQLFAFNGLSYVLVGPDGLDGFDKTALEATILIDNQSIEHAVLTAYVDGDPIFVVSTDDEFILGTQSQTELGGATKFGVIKKGLTLVGTNNPDGVSTNSIFWGTVSKSLNAENAENSLNTQRIVGGITGAVVYQAGTGITAFVNPNTTTTKKVLVQTGNETTASAPEWKTVISSISILKNDGTVVNVACQTQLT